MARRVDAPFLSKFKRASIYIESESDLFESIIDEIGNVLSAKLKVYEEDSPFSYGVRDPQSIDGSKESLDNFKVHCKRTILKYEPRIRDILITSCSINSKTQSLDLEMNCQLKLNGKIFTTSFSITPR